MNWFKTHSRLLMLCTASLLLSAFAIFLYNSSEWTWADWTGIGKDTSEIEEETLQNGKLTATKRITHYQSGKNLWDWLGLAGVIAIPIVLFQFQQQQQKKSEENAEAEKRQAEERAKVEKEQALERANLEKEIAATNLREEALQNYIDKIAELLIDKKLDVYDRKGKVRSELLIRKGNTKGKLATRSIPVIEDLRELLNDYQHPERGYLFPGRWGKGHINFDSAARILREAFSQVEIEGGSTHSFRRTGLTQLSNAG